MATELAEKAKDAFLDDNFQLAVDLYSQAIALNPKSADLFADRAQANIKLENFTEAVDDANKAIELDPSMAKAYLRKGTACLKLEEYHTAKAALETGASLTQNDPRFTKLINECDQRIAEENNVLNKLSVPNGQSTALPASVGILEEPQKGSGPSHNIATVKPKYRHEYYQKPDEVVVTIFAKGIPAKNVVVDFGEQIVSIYIDIPGEDAYIFQPRLFAKIVPDKCRYQVLSTKVEIRLVKAEPIQWSSLEYSKETTVQQKIIAPPAKEYKLSYPSSKPRTKDWGKLEAEVKKEEKEEKLDGDAALNKLFKDIYLNADENMKRAMTKSFVESNGTVLSTDWKEVGSKKVEGSPPEGMELKKWEI